MRICSLLPSATEILFALGLGDCVAGVTFECDYPPEARTKPVLVRTRLAQAASPGEVDRQVGEYVARGESLYTVDFEALCAIAPDLIVTQDLCHVCAASPDDLGTALARLPRRPRVLTLRPRSLADVWNDIVAVGEATGREGEARTLVAELRQRVADVETSAAAREWRPRVVCLEWLDPPFVAGHWVPEMVAKAGGTDALGRAGEPSFRVSWEPVLAAKPEVILVMPCGYTLEQVLAEGKAVRLPRGWEAVPAVCEDRVFALDANSYFSRPGPRLADGVELLARLLRPSGPAVSWPPGAARLEIHS